MALDRAMRRIAVFLIALAMFGLVPCSTLAQPDSSPDLRSFYIGVESVSDSAPFWSDYVLHVLPGASGTTVRWIRIAPLSPACATPVTVKALKVTVSDSAADLAGQPNLCALPPARLNASLENAQTREAISDTSRYGIVLQCGAEEKTIALPFEQTINFNKLNASDPDTASLYRLYGRIIDRVFGPVTFANLGPDKDIQLQRIGESVIADLRSGEFDHGFAEGPISEVLEDYRGVVPEPQFIPRLVVPDVHEFADYTAPVYPQSAKGARVEGQVDLELQLDPASGNVRTASVFSGNPMLRESAVAAAKQWRYDVSRFPGKTTVHAIVDYSLKCE